MVLLFVLLLLVLGSAAVATIPRHNVYRGQHYNWLHTRPLSIQHRTIDLFSDLITETISSRSYLQCSSHCLGNIKCAGILYDEQQNCHLLSATTGIKEQADESGTVKVILYGLDDSGKVGHIV